MNTARSRLPAGTPTGNCAACRCFERGFPFRDYAGRGLRLRPTTAGQLVNRRSSLTSEGQTRPGRGSIASAAAQYARQGSEAVTSFENRSSTAPGLGVLSAPPPGIEDAAPLRGERVGTVRAIPCGLHVFPLRKSQPGRRDPLPSPDAPSGRQHRTSARWLTSRVAAVPSISHPSSSSIQSGASSSLAATTIAPASMSVVASNLISTHMSTAPSTPKVGGAKLNVRPEKLEIGARDVVG